MRSGLVVPCGLAVVLAACSVKAVTYTPAADQLPDAGTSGPTEDCATPGDEDGNGLADCADPACASAAACQPVCGNGKVEAGEQCDDGNTANGDECSSTCQNVSCTASLVPPMTSPTTPRGQVFRSGVLDDGDEAWQAFDRSSTQWISALDQTPAQIGYQFADGPHKVKAYSITFVNGSLTSRAPRDWTFEGWNGSSWVVVDTREGQTNWLGLETRTFAVASPGVYAMYRLNITEDNDPRPDAPIIVVSIGELDFVGCP